MSGFHPGHEQQEAHDPYIDYAHPEGPPEERAYVSHVQDIQNVGAQGLNTLGQLGVHHHPHQPHPHPQQVQQHQVLLDPRGMAHHQSPQFGGGQGMISYDARQMQQPTGGKRQRDDLELEMVHLPEGSMQTGGLQRMPSQMPEQSMVGYGGQSVQTYHSHPLPNTGHRSKVPRTGDPDSSMMSGGGGAPSVVGLEGMPQPAPRPRGPKLKFTPEDDQLLVDLKENKSLTWKQIAEFFPGRSSGTLQVRYCTKLKAKTTQWSDETIQKLRTALHDYEQEKWRIIAQKVGAGFTSQSCKEKASELDNPEL
ncbi:hypothetical protein D0Z07_4830 [Hyphodiscus hymeniophilus]|uniref:Myb-like domain-containing protein n=1 Tax=Hyphodiscus hymeniophilus TaxID=353542 RepID=A0A9P6VJP2_9HELO|nr:hypothetical protein D0Z07_4830 [Hyphodiscus hymeniophilus]